MQTSVIEWMSPTAETLYNGAAGGAAVHVDGSCRSQHPIHFIALGSALILIRFIKSVHCQY